MSSIAEYAKREWTNKLFKLIFQNFDDSHHISGSPNLTIDIIHSKPQLSWCWWLISSCRNITTKDIENNPELPYQAGLLRIQWNYWHVSKNPNLTIDFVLSHPKETWDWCEICKNPNITMSDIETHLKLFEENVAKMKYFINPNDFPCAKYISCNPNLTMEFIKRHPSPYWDWDEISRLPLATMETVLRHPARDWNWFYLSSNPSITMQNILDYPYVYPWNYYEVAENPNLTREMLDAKKMDFYWSATSYHVCKNMHNIEKILDEHTQNMEECNPIIKQIYEKCMDGICCNKHLSMDYVAKHPEYNWDWDEICNNPNLTLDFIVKNPNAKWNWKNICRNPLDNDRNNYIDTFTKQILLATMCEYYCNGNNYANDVVELTKIEYVLADDFLVSLLAKY